MMESTLSTTLTKSYVGIKTNPLLVRILWKIFLLLLYKAAVRLQINGPCHRLLRNLLVPTEQ